MDEDGQVLDRAIGWLGQGRQVAFATVIGTWGSAPRAPGSLLALADDSAFVGSVSGGCIEGAVIEEGRGVIAGGAARVLDFGISDEQAWEVGLACGGEMKVYVERAPRADTLRALVDERPVALVTELATGAHALVRPDRVGGDFSPSPEIVDAARRALAEDRSLIVPQALGELFINVFNRPLRMVVVGAVHIAQGLAPMAALAGFRRDGGRSPPGLRHRRPVSGRHHQPRLARYGARGAGPRFADCGGHAHPRSQARRSRARRRAEVGRLLHRRARQPPDPCETVRPPRREGLFGGCDRPRQQPRGAAAGRAQDRRDRRLHPCRGRPGEPRPAPSEHRPPKPERSKRRAEVDRRRSIPPGRDPDHGRTRAARRNVERDLRDPSRHGDGPPVRDFAPPGFRDAG